MAGRIRDGEYRAKMLRKHPYFLYLFLLDAMGLVTILEPGTVVRRAVNKTERDAILDDRDDVFARKDAASGLTTLVGTAGALCTHVRVGSHVTSPIATSWSTSTTSHLTALAENEIKNSGNRGGLVVETIVGADDDALFVLVGGMPLLKNLSHKLRGSSRGLQEVLRVGAPGIPRAGYRIVYKDGMYVD